MDHVQLARSLFGSSMAIHIIFATLGVGLPIMIIAAEVLFHTLKDSDYATMAKEMDEGLRHPARCGDSVRHDRRRHAGAALAGLHGGSRASDLAAIPDRDLGVFLEALFMSIYVYAADRLRPWMRIVSVIFVAVGATGSAVLITDAHAWMNTPAGFTLTDGKFTDVHPWQAVFNPSFYTTALHVSLSGYMTGAFAVASVAAYKLLRPNASDRERVYHRKGLVLALIIGGVMSLGTALNGHETAQTLHTYEPEKLAAAEGLFETRAHAPLAIGGIVDADKQEIRGAIEIPWALSFLAGNSFDTVVKGLNEFLERTGRLCLSIPCSISWSFWDHCWSSCPLPRYFTGGGSKRRTPSGC